MKPFLPLLYLKALIYPIGTIYRPQLTPFCPALLTSVFFVAYNYLYTSLICKNISFFILYIFLFLFYFIFSVFVSEKILLTYLSNALKFTSSGQVVVEVSLFCAPKVLSASEQEDYVRSTRSSLKWLAGSSNTYLLIKVFQFHRLMRL